MRIVLALLLALTAGGVMAHPAASTATSAARAKATPTSLMEALQSGRDEHRCAAEHRLALVDVSNAPLIGGPVYCRKMLVCCDNGNASCCALFERYCDPG